MMTLFYSPNSPYVRKVRMTIIEKGLSDQVLLSDASPSQLPDDLLAANPLAKVPTLQRDDGPALTESSLICEYLDSLTPEPGLLPASGEARWRTLRLQALASGIIDATYLATVETRRPEGEQSPGFIEVQQKKIVRAVDALNGEAAELGETLSLGSIALAAALGYVDLRQSGLNWREGREALAAWFETAAARPSFVETAPPG